MKYSVDNMFGSNSKTSSGLTVNSERKEGNLGTRGMPLESKVNRDVYKKENLDPTYSAGYKASYTGIHSENGVPVLDSVTYMTKEGDLRTIKNVPYVRTPGTSYSGIPDTVLIQETNPLAAAMGDPSAVVAFAGQDTIALKNTSIPQEIKIKQGTDSYDKSSKDACWATKFFGSSTAFMEAQAKGMAGDITDRNYLVLQQGRGDRSPSLIINEENGALYLADSTGKQNMKMANGGTTFTSADFDTGMAVRSRNIVMQENPVTDTLPTGTILTPQPVLIPHFAKLANTVLSIMDMVDLVQALGDAVKLIAAERRGDKEEADKARADIAKQENANTYKRGEYREI